MKKEYFALRVLAIALAFALIASLAVFSVYSWYDRTKRDDEAGHLLSYTQTGRVNNTTGISVKTYAGIADNGVVTYEDTELQGAVDVKAGELSYFKTVITDTANAGGAVVSLYLKDFTYNSSLGEKIHIGIVNPEKTYVEYAGALSGTKRTIDNLCLEDNIIVDNNGTVEVYWFVKPSTSITATDALNIGTMCIAYN